jgi:hypothetical protein
VPATLTTGESHATKLQRSQCWARPFLRHWGLIGFTEVLLGALAKSGTEFLWGDWLPRRGGEVGGDRDGHRAVTCQDEAAEERGPAGEQRRAEAALTSDQLQRLAPLLGAMGSVAAPDFVAQVVHHRQLSAS